MNYGWTKKREMSPVEFRHTLKRLGMSQAAAGRFLGVSERTARRYARGAAAIPVPSVLLLRAILAGKRRLLYVPRRRD